MRRIKYYLTILLCLLVMVGCKNKVESLNPDDLQVSTMLVRENGQVQAYFIEDFNKAYYSESELKTFVNKNIKDYNLRYGKKAIRLESLAVKKKVATALFTYADIDKYSKINNVEAYYLTAKEAKDNKLIPDNLLDTTKGDTHKKDEVLKNEKLKVLIVNEPLDVVVDGIIKYYANAILLSKNSVQSAEEGYSVIIFKP